MLDLLTGASDQRARYTASAVHAGHNHHEHHVTVLFHAVLTLGARRCLLSNYAGPHSAALSRDNNMLDCVGTCGTLS